MLHGRISKNGFPPHHIFMWDTKSNFQSYGYRVTNQPCHMEEYPKLDPPRLKSSCDTQNTIGTPMEIRLGIDYVTWGSIQKLFPTHLIFICDTNQYFRSYRNRVRNCLCDLEEYPEMDALHIQSSCGTQSTISNPIGIGLGIDYGTWRNIQKWIPPHQIFTARKIQFPILLT